MSEEFTFLMPPTRQLGLPADTMPITANEAQFFLISNGSGKLVPQLALHTDEMGWYRIEFAADTLKSLLAQAVALANMTPEQTRELAAELSKAADFEGNAE